MAEIFFEHNITYDLKGNASVSDVASSLLANERLVRYASMVLEDCIDGFKVDLIDIKVNKVTHNSPLAEALVGLLIVTYQRDLVREVPPIIEHFLGVKVSDKYKTIVTVLAMAIAIYGASAASKAIFPDRDTSNLDKDYKTLTYIAGDYISMPQARIEYSISNNLSGPLKPQAKRTGIDFFRPSKKEGVGILGPMGLKISKEAVQEVPNDFDLTLEDDIEQYPLQNVTIEIRALDKDRKKQGWYAVVQEVTKKRLKMQIYPTIDPNSIFGMDSIKGDIIVVNKRAADGDFQPSMYHLVKINDKS